MRIMKMNQRRSHVGSLMRLGLWLCLVVWSMPVGHVAAGSAALADPRTMKFDPVTFTAAESLVDSAGQIALRVQANPFQGRFRILPPVAQTHVFTNRDAFESCRFLPGEREAQPGPFVHGERKKIGAPKEDLPGARLVAVASHEEISQGGLAGTVGSKQGMDFTGLHGEIESIENPVVSDLTGEAANV